MKKTLLLIFMSFFIISISGCDNSKTTSVPSFIQVGKEYDLDLGMMNIGFKVIKIAENGWIMVELTGYSVPIKGWLNTNEALVIRESEK